MMNPALSYIAKVNKIASDRKAAGLCPRCGMNPPESDGICLDCQYEEDVHGDSE